MNKKKLIAIIGACIVVFLCGRTSRVLKNPGCGQNCRSASFGVREIFALSALFHHPARDPSLQSGWEAHSAQLVSNG